MPILRGVEYHGGGCCGAGTEGGHIPGGSRQPPDRDQQHSPADAGQHQHNGGGKPDRHRHQRAGPGAGRRRGDGQRGAAGRRAGRGQIHPAAAAVRGDLQSVSGSVYYGRGIGAAGEAACRPSGHCAGKHSAGCRERHRPDLRPDRAGQARPGGGRLHPDHAHHGPDRLDRQRLAGEGVRRPPAECGKKSGNPHLYRGPCEQGRRDRRPEGDGAHRGHGAVL